MEAAARHGDYRAAISNATWLQDRAAESRFRSDAAGTLVGRANAAARQGDLSRARELIRQSRRYAASTGATTADRRVDGIERARRVGGAAG
jgi:ATP/maltotriose-dependent transcriptional regulator MalT